MGLLEKALTYKKDINEKGQETVMDKIAGPASTEFLPEDENIPADNSTASEKIKDENEVLLLDNEDLVPVEADTDDKTEEKTAERAEDGFAEPSEIVDEKIFSGEEDLIPDFDSLGESGIEGDAVDDHLLEEFALEGNEIRKTLNESRNIEDEDPGTAGAVGEVKTIPEEIQDTVSEEDDYAPVEGNGDADEDVPETVESPGNETAVEEEILPEKETAVSKEETVSGSRAEIVEEEGPVSFEDYLLLYETEKEINNSTSLDDLFEIILFNLMGQIGSSTSSLLIPDEVDEERWIMALSRGVNFDNKGLYFDSNTGFLKSLIASPRLIDVDEYRDDPEFAEDYHHFLSVDARYIAPISFGEKLLAAVILGDKVTAEEYSDEDKEFISILCSAAAVSLEKLMAKVKLEKEIDGLRSSIRKYREIDWLQEQIKQEKSIDQVEVSLRSVFEELGILSFAVYCSSRDRDAYDPVFVELEDFLGLKESRRYIQKKCNFTAHLLRSEAPVVIEDFKHANMLHDVFGEKVLDNMNLFRAYPFVISDSLEGFICVFRTMGKASLKDIDLKLKKVSSFIFDYLAHIDTQEQEADKFIDTLDVLYKKIEEVIVNAEQLNIPVSLVMLSIKNYRRYYNLKGYEKGKELIEQIEKIVKNRLSDHDFSIRYDRHKILLVLPGKDKHFTVPLANVIRNKIVDTFSDQDIQLLVTFLTAQFPDDGNDINSLIDLIE